MKIIATAGELLERGLWMKYCEETGTNDWAINEGLMSEDEIIEWELKPIKEPTK